jgi:signal transduction histidine kinase
MQDDTLSELQINGLNTIYTAANRLSKLNHDLAFLTKIDNNQFQELTTVNLREFISKKLEQFEDLIALKNIVVNKNFIANPTLQINDTLIYVLVTNLLNNAIKHNFEGGVINVKIKENEIAIENTGEPLPKGENAKDLFLRFRKASQSKDPSGLGLALVKKICEIYGFQPIYSVNRGMHKITIIF